MAVGFNRTQCARRYKMWYSTLFAFLVTLVTVLQWGAMGNAHQFSTSYYNVQPNICIITFMLWFIPKLCSVHSNQISTDWNLKDGINKVYSYDICGPGSSVGIATAYGLDGLGIESRWGRDFPHLSRPALRPHQASCTMGTGSLPGVRCGRGVTLTPHSSSAEVKNRVQLYLYSP